MARNEDGEFELAIGTRQLLTLVFILMVLFGVVFSMGYFVGRNSLAETPSASAARQPGAESSGSGRPAPTEGSAPPAAPAAEGPAGASLQPGEAQVASSGTMPVRSATPEPAKPPAPAPAETKPPVSPPPKPAPAAANQTPLAEPPPGQTFLQVAAVKQPEAELIVQVLKKKGFSALIAPAPGETLFRVLVGPLKDSAALAKSKADLEQTGFRSIIRKY